MSVIKAEDLGQVLQVEYDYTYVANDGKKVTIKQGEEYVLIKKSNVDWWQVIRLEQKKPFYIPASYVKVLSKKKFPKEHTYFKKAYKTLQKSLKKPSVSGDDVADDSVAVPSTSTGNKSKERTIYLTKSREDLNVVSLSADNSKVHVTRASSDSLDRFIENENPYDEVPLQVHIDSKQNKQKLQQNASTSSPATIPAICEPEYENLEVIRQAVLPATTTTTTTNTTDHTSSTGQNASSNFLSPTGAGDAEPRKHVRTSSVSTFKPNSPNHASRPTDHHIEDTGRWEVNLDNPTGVNYLYNRSTGEMRDFTKTYSFKKSKHSIKVVPPPPLPDPSKKNKKISLSPSTGNTTSALQRRLSSPARYRSKRNWPVAKYRRNNNNLAAAKDDISPLRSHDNKPSSSRKPKDDSHQGDQVFHDSTNSSTQQQPTRLNDALTRTLSDKSHRSGSSSTTTSPGPAARMGSPTISITTSPPLSPSSGPLWYQDHNHCPSSDGDAVWVNSATGERWHQMMDDSTHQYYYFNEISRETAWQLPELPHGSTLKNSMSEHHFLSEGLIQRQGRLNWTKLFEAGKKQRKHWQQQWVVLLANNLLFYKDQKQALPTKTFLHGKPESSCDLRGAKVDWAKQERSSKKNVVELQTIRGLSLLLQHDDISTITKWLETIKSTIDRVDQNNPLDPNEVSRNVEDEDENHTCTSTDVSSGKNKKKKDKKKSKAPSRHGSDAKNSDKVRNKLKKFIGKRPTFESLQERGIIKETVFGCPLNKLCEKEQTTIPKFIKVCVEEVDRRGLDVDGIYRVSGNLSHVQRLRYLVDRDETPDLSQPEWEDIHLVTGALKMFLRELPEPVIPFDFFDKFIAACKLHSEQERINTMRSLVRVLPRVNSDTLTYLLQHFRRVVEHSSQNRMQVQNIAIVFGPTLLLKPPDVNAPTDPLAAATGGHMAVYMVYQNQIVDTMLTEYLNIFN